MIDYIALIHAARAGDELLVGALLNRESPVNALDPDVAGDLSYFATLTDTPLQVAAENGHLEIAKLLVKRGAWLDAQCCDSATPIARAARGGHLDVVKFLLAAGADPSRAAADGTPLELAKVGGHHAVVRLLEQAETPR